MRYSDYTRNQFPTIYEKVAQKLLTLAEDEETNMITLLKKRKKKKF